MMHLYVCMYAFQNLLADTVTTWPGEKLQNYDFAFFGELYSDVFQSMDYRLSAGLMDNQTIYQDVWYSVYYADASQMEEAFSCSTCIDAYQLACVFSYTSDEYNGWCSSCWQRQYLGPDFGDPLVRHSGVHICVCMLCMHLRTTSFRVCMLSLITC